MKNKKKKIPRKLFLVSAILCLCVFSCQNDDWMNSRNATSSNRSKHKNTDLTVAAAQQWYDANQPPVVTMRSYMDQKQPGKLVKPGWKSAKESNRGRFEVVETPLMTRGSRIIVDAETNIHFNPENADPSIRNTARMVIMKDMKTGDTRSFIMIFVGSYKYLKSTKSMGKNSYLYREPDYEGSVLFYEPDGEFLNGWHYENGKIVAKITPGYGGENKAPVSTRAWVEKCESSCFPVYEEECEDSFYWEYDDEWGDTFVMDRNCYPVSYEDCYTTCWGYDDGDDGDDGDNDDDWLSPYPPGGVNPPGSGGSSGGSGGDPYAKGQQDLMNILPQIEKQLKILNADLDGVTVRFLVQGEICRSNAQIIKKDIVVCSGFFFYERKDQASIIWHELHHIKNDKPLSHTDQHTLDKPYVLDPPDNIKGYLSTHIHWLYPYRDESDTVIKDEYKHQLTLESLYPSNWYRNEIATYEAEKEHCIDVSENYKAEREFMYWKHQESLKLAEKYNK